MQCNKPVLIIGPIEAKGGISSVINSILSDKVWHGYKLYTLSTVNENNKCSLKSIIYFIKIVYNLVYFIIFKNKYYPPGTYSSL